MPQPADRRASQGSALMWFGVLGGGVAWSLHLLASYLLAESVCAAGPPRFELWGIPGTYLILLAFTVVSGLVALAALLVSARQLAIWRGHDEHRAAAYLCLAGLVLSAVFLVIILAQGLPPLFLEVC